MRILVVEDSTRLLKHVARALRHSGYAVDTAADGEEGFWYASENPYDVIVLDIMLPKLDGMTLLRRLREGGRETPVLFLTAKDTVDDRVAGLESGADDYLVKPFALEELLARVRVLCRRAYRQHGARLTVADLELDLHGKTARRGGVPIDLPAREFALLEYLMSRAGEVVSRTEIEQHIYDDQVSPMSNVVDAAIYSLRKMITVPADAPQLIHTRRGLGYVMGASPE